MWAHLLETWSMSAQSTPPFKISLDNMNEKEYFLKEMKINAY